MINGIKDVFNHKPWQVEVGQIRIGEKNEKGYPTKLGHFVIKNPTRKGKDLDVLGINEEKPKRLKISLIYDDIDQNLLNFYGRYEGKRLRCRGDGEKAILTDVDGPKHEQVCGGHKCLDYKEEKCKTNGIFFCNLQEAPGLFGNYIFRCKSYHTTKRLKDSLRYFSNLTGGILAGLSFEMVIKEEFNDNGNMFIVHLEYPGSIKELQMEAIEIMKVRKELESLTGNKVEFKGNSIEDAILTYQEDDEDVSQLQEEIRDESEKVEKEIKERPAKNNKTETDKEKDSLTSEQKEIIEICELSKEAQKVRDEFLKPIKYDRVEDLPDGYVIGLLKKLKSKAS